MLISPDESYEEGNIDTSEIKPCYFIDLNWYEENNRSFSVLAQGRMCNSCQRKAGADPFMVIRDCCSKSEDFITPDLPFLELIFRIFLANANQPLDREQLLDILKERLANAGGTSSISAETSQRLIENDHYYGLRRFPSEEA